MSLSGMVDIPRLQAKQVYIPSPRKRGEGQGEGNGVLYESALTPSLSHKVGEGEKVRNALYESALTPCPLPQGAGESVGFEPTTSKATGLKPAAVYFA
jgi:hypothetical protein